MIYLDNAATTHKKPLKTIFSVLKALTVYNANPSRGSHTLSIKTSLKIEECRENIKKFVNAPTTASVVYTYNCTEAINYAIQGTLNYGDHVIITTFEHNAVLRTLANLKQKNIDYSVVKPNTNGEITVKDIQKLRKNNTKMIIINQTSNVIGKTTDIYKIGKYCKENGILLLTDCAQSAGHKKINMTKNNINFVTLAGHKGLYGTQGIGALVINNASPSPIKFGGSGSNSKNESMPDYYPDKLEAGTINVVGILALDAGIRFVQKKQDKINKKIDKLSKILIDYLKEEKNYILYSEYDCCGVVSFNHRNIETAHIVDELNKYNICVRGGLHCAPLAHSYIGTIDTGTVRVSISYFNNKYEIKKLIKVLNKINNKNR